MAEEVGQAYVSIIPSARNLSRMIKEELKKALRGIKGEGIEVPVKPKFDEVTGALRSELQRQMNSLAKRIAIDLPVGADTDGLRQQLTSQLAEMRASLSMSVPTEPAGIEEYQRKLKALLTSTSNKLVQPVRVVSVDPDGGSSSTSKTTQRVDTDFDTKDAGDKAFKAGGTLSDLFLRGFGSGLLNPVIGIPVLIAAALAAPIAGGLVAAATVFGGGLALIAMGAFGLRADEELKKALAGLGATVNKTLADAAQPLKAPFIEAIGILSKAIADMGPTLKEVFDIIGPSIPILATGLAGFMLALKDTGALKKLADTVGPLLGMLAMALPDLGNAVAQFLISVSKPETVIFFGALLRATADVIRILGGVVGFLVGQFAGFVAIIKGVGTVVGWIVDGFRTLWAAIWGDEGAQQVIYKAADGIHNFAVMVKKWWDDLWSGMGAKVRDTASSVAASAAELPGKVMAAVGNLGTLLLDAGKNVVQGLIHGIKSKLGSLGDMASAMAGVIRNRLPFSPAKEGPLSGSGAPFESGKHIAGDLAAGVRSQLPTVAGAASDLAGMFGVGGPGSARTSAVAAAAGITIDTAGSRLDQLLLAVLKEVIREAGHGDDPVAALRS